MQPSNFFHLQANGAPADMLRSLHQLLRKLLLVCVHAGFLFDRRQSPFECLPEGSCALAQL